MDGLNPSRPGSVNKRLWKGGILLALVFVTFIVGNLFVSPDKSFSSKMYGKDFLPFYTAGQFIRAGRLHEIYDPVVLSAAEQATEASVGLEVRHVYGAWLNPPTAALPAVWLARWPYQTALSIWTVILVTLLVAASMLLIKLFPQPRRWQDWALVPLLLFAAFPVWQAMTHAQNTFFSFVILAATVHLWRRGYGLIAGLVAGFLSLKPQLGAVVAVVLVACEGRRAFLGLAISGLTLLVITVLTLPGSLGDFLHQLPAGLRLIQAQPDYTWHRHVTWLGFWRILLQGHVAALPTLAVRILADLCCAASAAALAFVVIKYRNNPESRDRIIVATIASMPLIMPYYMDYDLTLLAVAAVLCAVDFQTHGVDRRIITAWTVFYLILEVNPGLAGVTRIIFAVPALAVLSGLLVRRAASTVRAFHDTPSFSDSPNSLPLAA